MNIKYLCKTRNSLSYRLRGQGVSFVLSSHHSLGNLAFLRFVIRYLWEFLVNLHHNKRMQVCKN